MIIEHLDVQVVKEGKGSTPRTNQHQRVTIRMEGILPDGRKVDCLDQHSFLLGVGDVIEGM